MDVRANERCGRMVGLSGGRAGGLADKAVGRAAGRTDRRTSGCVHLIVLLPGREGIKKLMSSSHTRIIYIAYEMKSTFKLFYITSRKLVTETSYQPR